MNKKPSKFALVPILLISICYFADGSLVALASSQEDPPATPADESQPADATGTTESESSEPEYTNTLKWSTASEVDNFGFDIFRSENEDGPFKRINPETIAGQGTTDEPTFYEYVDDTIDPTRAYYYFIESISLANEREKFTPIFRAKPKKPVEEEN